MQAVPEEEEAVPPRSLLPVDEVTRASTGAALEATVQLRAKGGESSQTDTPLPLPYLPATLHKLRDLCSQVLGVTVGKIFQDDPFARQSVLVESDRHLAQLLNALATRMSRQTLLRRSVCTTMFVSTLWHSLCAG